jgi:histone-lysine N-methyltransferase SETMAR
MGWEVLPHPPYSPDLAPSDYHLFGFVKNQIRGQHYEKKEELRQLCVNVFGQLERSSTAREYSNFQNGWKNVYRETGIM